MGAMETFCPDALALFNRWQRGLPLVPRPFDALGVDFGLSGAQVREQLRRGLERGEISRVGAVFGVGAGGAGMLCALRVPACRLEQVAEWVSDEPGVNHNYAREHEWNLWFVVTANDAAQLQACVERIERRCGLRALRLPMRQAYRIDLGFDLFGATAAVRVADADVMPVSPVLRPLAARLEDGVPLVERPWAALGAPMALGEGTVMTTLRRWVAQGTVRRLGVVLRHHELGIAANAMTVFALPDSEVDDAGARLAVQPGVTLCYRREPASDWPYTLYCMVHGREGDEVRRRIDAATRAAGLSNVPREVLFSTRRFKQTGARYFAS